MSLSHSNCYTKDLSVLLTFCPAILCDYHLKHDPENVPANQHVDGACIIADISGFVNLCGKYCKRGTDGLDDLQKCTSSFVGDMVNVVHQHGGDGKTVTPFCIPCNNIFFYSYIICW